MTIIKLLMNMILQPDHTHEHELVKTLEIRQPETIQPPPIFKQLYDRSAEMISEKGRKEIKHKVKFMEEKIFLAYSENTTSYLEHLFNKHQSQSQDYVAKMLSQRYQKVTEKIENQHIQIKTKPINIKQLNQELAEKLKEINSGFLNLSSLDQIKKKKLEAQYQNYNQFRKKSYWLKTSEKTDNAKNFLHKMRKIKSQHKRKYQQSIQKQEITIKQSEEKEKQDKQKLRKMYISKQIEKQQVQRKDRIKYNEENKIKKQEIHTFLSKINIEKPIFLRNEEKFRKQFLDVQEEQRQKKLQQIRQSHQPWDQEDLDEHLQRYQQYKDSLKEEIRKRQEEEDQEKRKIQEELKSLFHSKHHQNLEPRFKDEKLELIAQRKKINQYSKEVLEKYKPIVDPRKRTIIENKIKELELHDNKNKKKIVQEDGSIVFEDKIDLDHRKIGVSYLEFLRKQNEGKVRKNPQERSASMMQLAKSPHKIDYLRENRPNLKLKSTLSSWKKVLDNKSYTSKDKYQSVINHVSALELAAKQKESMLKNMKKEGRSMELKEELDKYYLESVAAKMVILKDVLLK